MESKRKRLSNKNIIVLLIVIFVLALIIETMITAYVQKMSMEKTTTMFLNQVENVLNNNEREEQSHLDELKYNYTTVASAAAYILSEDPKLIGDVAELRNIASLLSIDEIHIFDETGTIIAGTNPEYYGYSFDSGEQMAYFKPMLEDKSLSMCQDVTPNTAESKSMMYAITWAKTGDYMVQIGVKPTRLLNMLKNHEISNVINGIPITSGFDIYAVDLNEKKIAASTNEDVLGSDLPALFMTSDFSAVTDATSRLFEHGGKVYLCNYKVIAGYLICVAYKMDSNSIMYIVPLFIIAVYLLIAEMVMYAMFRRLQSEEEKKNEELKKHIEEVTELNQSLKENTDMIMEQYSMLKSLADIYYSMHLINLRDETLDEYNAHGKVKEIVNGEKNDAFEMMRRVISEVVTEEYLEQALAFTELTTLAERVGKKKIITAEFVGKNIGWFQASFIVAERDENGEPEKVIFTTRSIDKDKKKEEKLIYRSNTDELTKTYNRRAYEDAVREIKKNGMEDDFVYISYDINGLKIINDTIGHEGGDEIIVGACECILKSINGYGNLYRTGGDELIAMLNADSREIEEIFSDFEKYISSWHGKLVDSLTVSYGVVTLAEDPARSIHEIAVLADKRMYEAKSLHYSKEGIDRRGQKDAQMALCALYTKILKINITDDTYQIINMDTNEQTEEKGFTDKISSWLKGFGTSGQVYPGDLENYLKLTDIAYMKKYFESDKTSLHITYRRKYEDGYKKVMMEIIPANDYSKDNQNLFLYVKNIDK